MTAVFNTPGFAGPDAPADADLYRCVRCGLCLQSCPTYVETGLEPESPRGRLAFMKAIKEQRLGLTEQVVARLESCVQCRACEEVCPSGVPFGRVMEATRAEIVANTPRSRRERLARFVAFRVLLPHPRLLRSLVWGLKLYERLGVQWVLREFRLLAPFKRLDRMEQQLPSLGRFSRKPDSRVIPSSVPRKRRVAMLSGCVMPLIYGRVNEATIRVLARNGCEVVMPSAQGCCGALHTHSGEREAARALARRNIDAFLSLDVDAIIVNAAGCSAAMKEYDELLKDDPVYRERAAQFSGMVRDVNLYLASLPLEPPQSPIRARVTYQDSCHLAHAQRTREAPRKILRSIPGLDLVEMESADMCCGSGGIYSLTHRELSTRILDHKMQHVGATGAEILATANPGCMLQLEWGARRAGLRARVVHVVELLDEAYRG